MIIEQYINRTEYKQNGMLHRKNGPAIIYVGGAQLWYLNNKLHCDIGPAITYANGTTEYWLNGQHVTNLE